MSNRSAFAQMRRVYERGRRSRGLVVDRDGVALGPDVVLVRHSAAGYRCARTDDLVRLTRLVFTGDARFQRLPAVLAQIARALDAGDLVKAQLLGLEIPIGELDDSQLARLAGAADLVKVGFDPSQPRDEGGRWTSEGGGDGAAADAAGVTPVQIADASEGISDAGGILPVADAHPGSRDRRTPIDMSEITNLRKQPVKVLDDRGQDVLDQKGGIMWRPKDMDPQLFVDRGLRAAEAMRNASPDAGPVGLDPMILDEIEFRQGGSLDAQRVDGRVVRQYVDYATVGIGLYGAAAGIPLDEMLANENEYARWHPRPPGQEMDETYRFLPKRNVANTKLGYDLYSSGRVGPSRNQ